MLEFEKALEIVLNSTCRLGSERVGLSDCAGRVLAEDVRSDIDMPPFKKSLMDGFACRRADIDDELNVIETIAAGSVPQQKVGKGQCAKIMTGSMVPDGADCVIMKEYVEYSSKCTIRFIGESTDDNICQKAQDIKAGQVVLKKGLLLRPQHIAVLATVGCSQPLVSKMPRVGIIATGSELVDPASLPGPAQIRNSNSYQLTAQAQALGAVTTNYGITGDTIDQTDAVLKRAISENDIVIISGGISEGDFDIVPDVLRQNDIDLLFERLDIKPGKRMVFGISDQVYCFALPGNPVSTFVLFEILIKPFIYKLMGCNQKPRDVLMALDRDIIRKNMKSKSWVPVKITDKGTVEPVEYKGSAHIGVFCNADGLICLGIGKTSLDKGASVSVRLI